jgi:hypothetical protein
MGLRESIESAVAALEGGPVGELRTTVKHTTYTGRDAFGPTNPVTTDRLAIVEDTNEVVHAPDGRMLATASKLTFLESVAVKDGDVFAIPPSTVKLPVAKVNGLRKPGGASHYITEVWLGKPTQSSA